MNKFIVVIFSLYSSLTIATEELAAKNSYGIPIQASACFEEANLLPGYMISGQGIGKDKKKAKSEALQDISHQLSVEVDSTVNTHTQLKDSQVNEGYSSTANLTSNTKLTGVKQICDYFSKQHNNHYVLYAIDNRPPILKLAQKLVEEWGNIKPHTVAWSGNEHLIKSTAITQLTKLITDPKAPASLVKHVPVGLTYYNDSWRLNIDLVNQVINSGSIVDFFKLPKRDENFNFSVKRLKRDKWLSTKQLKEGDEFRFELNGVKDSFFQLINIYQDGRVAALTGIRRLTSEKMTVPTEDIFVAGLLTEGNRTVDIYLAIVSDKPFDPLTLEQVEAWEGIVKGKEAYQLSSLLLWLEEHDKSINISGIKVITTPK